MVCIQVAVQIKICEILIRESLNELKKKGKLFVG